MSLLLAFPRLRKDSEMMNRNLNPTEILAASDLDILKLSILSHPLYAQGTVSSSVLRLDQVPRTATSIHSIIVNMSTYIMLLSEGSATAF